MDIETQEWHTVDYIVVLTKYRIYVLYNSATSHRIAGTDVMSVKYQETIEYILVNCEVKPFFCGCLSFSMETSRVNGITENGYPGSVSESPPTGKKKKLIELFRESFRDDHDISELNTSSNQGIANEKTVKPTTIQDILPQKSADGTPYVSAANSQCSSERTSNGDNPILKEKPIRSVQRCLPSLVSCGSFSERKKMAMS
ncbi:putative ribulose-5-phosphate-3-epimerase [Hibiscus syriacus]|uniref:Ribulose-5-phosphate-3-epimerase n=1 Tax=Hibiscus syriacus TaxID=106335 RepID=A0A6A2ZUI1_HIBSY|nr:putative ribulose-5-phosphate-3-epimerase [Hibiscus syriacus]